MHIYFRIHPIDHHQQRTGNGRESMVHDVANPVTTTIHLIFGFGQYRSIFFPLLYGKILTLLVNMLKFAHHKLNRNKKVRAKKPTKKYGIVWKEEAVV